MSAPTTSDYLNQTTPAANSGDQNVVFQSDGATPEQSITAYPKRATASLYGTIPIDAIQQESYTYAADTGSANAYAVTLSPSPTLVAGSVVVLNAANANTGASTLAVNGGSAIAITKDGTTALAGGEIAAGQIVTVVYDGTNFQLAVGGSGAGSTVYYGEGEATASSGNNQITFGSTPITNSVKVFAGGSLVSPNTYGITGSVLKLTSTTFTSGADIVAYWATANSTPGTITVATAGLTNPVVRASGIQNGSASSFTVPFPAGATAGDLALISVSHCYSANTPSGWTLVDSKTGANWNGAVFSKVLSSPDITAGAVTVTFAGSQPGVLSIIVFVGGTGGIREADSSRNSSGSTSVLGASTSGAVLSTDTLVYFGSNRGTSSTDTVSRGTQEQQIIGTNVNSGCLYAEALSASGAVQPTFLYSVAGTGNYQVTVVVEGS